MNRRSAATGSRTIRTGILADGIFKLALSATYAVFAIPFGAWLDAPLWLVFLTALLLAVSAIAEVFASRRARRRHVFFLMTYDTTWLMLSIIALVMASRGFQGWGWTWLVFQALASAVLAVLFSVRAAHTRS